MRLRRGEGVEGRARAGEEGVENEEEGEEGAQRSCLALATEHKRCGLGRGGRRTLRTPVIQQADLLRHAQRDQIAESNHEEDRRQQPQRRVLGLEAAREGHAHALTQHPYQDLVVDGARVGEEEVGEREVQERDRGDDGGGRDERHGYCCCDCGAFLCVVWCFVDSGSCRSSREGRFARRVLRRWEVGRETWERQLWVAQHSDGRGASTTATVGGARLDGCWAVGYEVR